MEIHFLIIFNKVNIKKKKILSDIVNKSKILDVYNISWTKEIQLTDEDILENPELLKQLYLI
jgi:hypothetical protein